MLLYEVTVEGKGFWSDTKDKLLTTDDKELAEATVKILNSSMLNSEFWVARLVFKTVDVDVDRPFIWWYDEEFMTGFLEELWDSLRNKGMDPSYCWNKDVEESEGK